MDNAGNVFGHTKNILFGQQCRIAAKRRKRFKERSYNYRHFYFTNKHN
jgi:hypothetical protein